MLHGASGSWAKPGKRYADVTNKDGNTGCSLGGRGESARRPTRASRVPELVLHQSTIAKGLNKRGVKGTNKRRLHIPIW